MGARRARQVRDRGRSAAERGWHGTALVRQGKTRQLRDPRGLQDRHQRSNSGVYIRIAEKPKDEWYAVHHGFEVQIMDYGNADRRTGSIYTFAKAAAQPSKPREWNTLEITLKGNTVSTKINGVAVAEFDSSSLDPQAADRSGEGDPARGPRPESGYIGLQNHDKNSVVYFKEVSVRPLSSESQ